MKVRIQKLLATVGIDSRRHIEEMVLAGRISVNGKKVRSLPVMVNEEARRHRRGRRRGLFAAKDST